MRARRDSPKKSESRPTPPRLAVPAASRKSGSSRKVRSTALPSGAAASSSNRKKDRRKTPKRNIHRRVKRKTPKNPDRLRNHSRRRLLGPFWTPGNSTERERRNAILAVACCCNVVWICYLITRCPVVALALTPLSRADLISLARAIYYCSPFVPKGSLAWTLTAVALALCLLVASFSK